MLQSSSRAHKASNENNPRVFLDVSVDGGPPEKIVIELFANVAPKTAENFRALCTGEMGKSKTSGRPLHYKGTVFHQIYRGFFAHGGDLSEEQDGRGEDSIYGGFFEDEDHKLYHSEPGLLSMGNIGGGDTNGSLFLLTFKPLGCLDGLHVVFGKVLKGMPTLCHINEFGTPGGSPSGVVKIVDCGQLPADEGKKGKSLEIASSSDERLKEHGDEREKQSKTSPSAGQFGKISKDKKENGMESDQGRQEKSLKRPSCSDGRGKEVSDERDKRRRYLASAGQCGASSEDGKDDGTKSDLDRGFSMVPSRQEVGDDSDMDVRQQQIDWMMACIREMASAGGFHLPDYPLPRSQQGGGREQD